MNKKYLYETHLHTNEASACGVTGGADYIARFKELGYDGIFVTDHFFNGNCGIPEDLPWEERVELFCKGYENAKAQGEQMGLKVFFGFEVNFNNDEYLIYGLDKQWLLAHPEIIEWNHITHFQEISKAGGLVVQAHPFRERYYISEVYVHPHQCHAFEVANASNPTEQNQLAYHYAKKHNIPMTAGSDIHNVQVANDDFLYAMAFDKPLEDVLDYVKAVKEGKGYSLKISAEVMTWDGTATPHLPAFVFDENNQPHSYQ